MDNPMAEEMGPAADAPAGYVICVNVRPDGTFSVYKEDRMHEAAEPADAGVMPMEDEASDEAAPIEAAPIDSIEGALKAVLGIYKENPPSGETADDQMHQGFGGTDY